MKKTDASEEGHENGVEKGEMDLFWKSIYVIYDKQCETQLQCYDTRMSRASLEAQVFT